MTQHQARSARMARSAPSCDVVGEGLRVRASSTRGVPRAPAIVTIAEPSASTAGTLVPLPSFRGECRASDVSRETDAVNVQRSE